MIYEGSVRAAQNILWGTRVKVDPALWEKSRQEALSAVGYGLKLRRDQADVWIRGLLTQATLGGAITGFDSMSFVDRQNLTSDLGHERYQMEAQILKRGLLTFNLPYIFGSSGDGDEEVPTFISHDHPHHPSYP
ncbi:MAG: hypothetical protein HY399_05200 [Elusimicrobia bacterium]|nr:hypothetical protein [Elusimicrobiota bacterium]